MTVRVKGSASSLTTSTLLQGFTSGSVLFVDSVPSLAEDNANFFWDDSNNRLGLGTASPSANLHIANTADARILLEADTDNVTEGHNAYIEFLQDGSNVGGFIGFAGSAGTGPLGSYTDALEDALIAGTITLGSDVAMQLGAAGAVELTVATNGRVGIGQPVPGAKLEVEVADADNTVGILIDQNDTGLIALLIDSEATVDVIDITSPLTTTGNVVILEVLIPLPLGRL